MTQACFARRSLILLLAVFAAGAAGVAVAQDGPERAGDAEKTARSRFLPQKVLKVGKDQITVKPAMLFADQDKTPEPEVFKIDPKQTRVRVSVVVEEWKDDRGRLVQQTKLQPGTLADLKEGQEVLLRADNGVALDITIRPGRPKAVEDKGQEEQKKK